ncbi:MAG: hypothetical protein ABW123_23995 [Cystobacter sp.]
MKYIGGIIVGLYAVMAFSGWEPFTRAERGKVSRGAGAAVGAARYRSGGFMGGK